MSHTKIAQSSDEPLAKGSILKELITEVAEEVIQEERAKMSSTLNVKGNRKVVLARYYPPESIFKIPDGLDLEDKTVVDEWWIKYQTLYINYVDGREEEIEPEWEMEVDTKRPEAVEITDADYECVEYSDDEDD